MFVLHYAPAGDPECTLLPRLAGHHRQGLAHSWPPAPGSSAMAAGKRNMSYFLCISVYLFIFKSYL
jgi:hypothetical protein